MFFSKNGVVAPYRNADRQKAVNKVAYKYGTGTGTAYKVRDYIRSISSILDRYIGNRPHAIKSAITPCDST